MIRREPEQGLLSAAAKESLRRVGEDLGRVPPKLKPLLSHIEAHLFDPHLNVNQLKQACQIRDNSAMVRFHAAVGLPPGAYIAELRLETARRLLLGSSLPIWQIAEMVGYSTIQVFSQAFKRWSGERPTVFRRQRKRKGREPQRIEDELLRPKLLRDALLGRLETRRALGLIRSLQQLYAEKHPPAPEPRAARFDLAELERLRSRDAWVTLRTLSWEEQIEAVRGGFSFRTPALFHLLRKLSRELGREDRGLGIRLAELAVESLHALEPHLETGPLKNLNAQGWAWLGNARRLDLDLAGAEESFLTAERFLPREHRSRRVEAELLSLKAALRWQQRRFEEALELVDQAVPGLRALGASELLTDSLILRAALCRFASRFADGISDLREAIAHIDERQKPRLLLRAQHDLTVLFALTDQIREARMMIPRVERLGRQVGDPGMRHHLEWIRAFLHHRQEQWQEAEELFLAARDGFLARRESQHLAAVWLDLAICHAAQGQGEKVLELLAEALPVLDPLQAYREALAAQRLLREAVDSRQVPLTALEAARVQVERLRLAPLACQAEGSDSTEEPMEETSVSAARAALR